MVDIISITAGVVSVVLAIFALWFAKKESRQSSDNYNRGYRKCKKVIKGVWGMPRLLEAKKDVVSCDKPRGFANEN